MILRRNSSRAYLHVRCAVFYPGIQNRIARKTGWVVLFQIFHIVPTRVYRRLLGKSGENISLRWFFVNIFLCCGVWWPGEAKMTSSNQNIFRVTGHVCGEFFGHRWIPHFPTLRPVARNFDVSLICAWINDWVNNCEASDLRHHCAYHDVIVIRGYTTAPNTFILYITNSVSTSQLFVV